MISASVILRLTDLKYQGKIKKYNITVTSKNNEFGDVVKFFAQINKDDVIQKISFKATGCTAFIAVCSYFCEMVEGKSITNSLKITQEKINALVNLDEMREHVFPIILNTFASLVKKYRKGVENKTITPYDNEEYLEIEKNVYKDSKIKTHTKTFTNKINSNSTTVNNNVTEEKNKGNDNVELEIVSEMPNGNLSSNVINEDIKKVQSKHLNNLHNLVESQDNIAIESNINHSHDLSYLLQKVKDGETHKVEHKTTITTTTTKTVSVTANIDSDNINTQKNEDIANEVTDVIIENSSSKPKKKKSFFDLFKKKK